MVYYCGQLIELKGPGSSAMLYEMTSGLLLQCGMILEEPQVSIVEYYEDG